MDGLMIVTAAAYGWLGGLIAACPEIGQRIDGSYDTALSELTGHFAELFGLSLSDDLADA